MNDAGRESHLQGKLCSGSPNRELEGIEHRLVKMAVASKGC